MASRVKEKEAVAEVEPMEESTLGYSAEGGEEWGAFGSYDREEWVMPPRRRRRAAAGDDEGNDEWEDGEKSDEGESDEEGEDEEEGEGGEEGEEGEEVEEGEESSSAAAAPASSSTLEQQSGAVVKNTLVAGAVVSALHPRWNGWFYAEVVSVPAPGESVSR